MAAWPAARRRGRPFSFHPAALTVGSIGM